MKNRSSRKTPALSLTALAVAAAHGVRLTRRQARFRIEGPAAAARAALEQVGLLLGDVRKGSDDNAADGVVLRQSPAAGTAVPKGQKVDIVINE